MGSKGQRLSGWTDLCSFMPGPLPPRVTLGRSQKAGWTLSFFISRLMLMRLSYREPVRLPETRRCTPRTTLGRRRTRTQGGCP